VSPHCESALQTVYRAVVVAKLTYASSSWIGFSPANDRQKITAFIRRSKRTGFCSSQLDDYSSLCDAADTRFFTEILHNTCHVLQLQALLTPPADHNNNLRDRPHNRQLPDRMPHLTNCNFIVRMLFCESYWLSWLYSLFTFYRLVFYRCLHVCLQLRSDSCTIKGHLIWLAIKHNSSGSNSKRLIFSTQQ